MSHDESSPAPVAHASYTVLVSDLRRLIVDGRARAAAAVQTESVQTYWRIGERIVLAEQDGQARAEYGTQLLRRLGQTLSLEFGRGFAEQSLRAMRQFYTTFPNRSALRSELPWTAYRILMRLDEPRRVFYEHLAATGRWSSRELERQITSMLYERTGLSRTPESLVSSLPTPGRRQSGDDEVFRDPYVLTFLGLEDAYTEKDLETALVREIEKFLLALGTGFAFMERQKRLDIGGEDYYVDLVFFHRHLRAQVLVDLKRGRVTSADIGQMRLYLNWVRRYDMLDGENPPVGLILCGSKNEQVIELLLSDSTDSTDERIKVAQYLLLNSEEALRERLAEISRAYEQALHQRDETSGEEAPDLSHETLDL